MTSLRDQAHETLREMARAVSLPGRGEVWLADLDPTRGREAAGRRPVFVVSEDLFNQGPAGLAIEDRLRILLGL